MFFTETYPGLNSNQFLMVFGVSAEYSHVTGHRSAPFCFFAEVHHERSLTIPLEAKFIPRSRGLLTETFHSMQGVFKHLLRGLQEEERKTVMVGRYYQNHPKPMTWGR